VTIVCLDLKKALPLSDKDVANYTAAPLRVKAFIHGVVQAQAFNRHVGKDMPQEIASAVLHIPEEYTVGRCGIRRITSSWAKEHYPEANYELLFTLAANDGHVVHTLLMYYP
jgi:hypothetical protein